MSTSSITIKANNHRINQCPTDKKIELINKIILENEGLDIVVACSESVETLKENITSKNVKVMEDKEIVKAKDLSYEMLISYDLPIKAIVYMARLAKATKKAIFLVDEREQSGLHDIEMLLGRAIKQDLIEGFLYPIVEKKAPSRPAPKKMTQEQIKEEAKKRYDKDTGEPKEKSFKPKRDYGDKVNGEAREGALGYKDKKSYDKSGQKKDFKKSDSAGKWDKKKKEQNKFLGYDENGKAKFSGKSGERNHRFDGTPKDRYDAPKKVGKKINIKARKPKDQE